MYKLEQRKRFAKISVYKLRKVSQFGTFSFQPSITAATTSTTLTNQIGQFSATAPSATFTSDMSVVSILLRGRFVASPREHARPGAAWGAKVRNRNTQLRRTLRGSGG